MVIKPVEDRSEDIATLERLLERKDVGFKARNDIKQQLRNIRSGVKNEKDAAFELDFHFGDSSKNWMVIHGLRIKADGLIAQIDHLLIDRFLNIIVCESKYFHSGIAINEYGEFSTFSEDVANGIPSPIEQNRRHIKVLDKLFRSGKVAPPSRLGIALQPNMRGFVLVSKNARIIRPKKPFDGMETVIKNDQLRARFEQELKEWDQDTSILKPHRMLANFPSAVSQLSKVVSPATIEDFARRIVKAHKPLTFKWHAKFGLPEAGPGEEPLVYGNPNADGGF